MHRCGSASHAPTIGVHDQVSWLPLCFLTLNPADVLHPYTWKFALSTDLHVLDPARLDSSLRLALQDVNLWRIVAQDPAAAVQAFHLHVRLFLEILLDVNASATHLEPDGIASSTVRGILTPLSGAFGSIEPQQRGSLHIHFLLFCYGFHSPQTLLRRFATQLPLLESRLWAWVQSIVATAFEAVPRMFALDADALRSLRPFPYSDQNLRVMHPSYRQHILLPGSIGSLAHLPLSYQQWSRSSTLSRTTSTQARHGLRGVWST